MLLFSSLISGLGLGAMYGLMALGFHVTYAVSGTVNFAQGSSMMLGAVLTFAFSQGASTRIAAMTTQNQGKWIVAMLNGRPVDFVRIDKPVQDGRLVIWRGIKESEIFAFDYMIPHIGEDTKAWKARLKAHTVSI